MHVVHVVRRIFIIPCIRSYIVCMHLANWNWIWKHRQITNYKLHSKRRRIVAIIKPFCCFENRYIAVSNPFKSELLNSLLSTLAHIHGKHFTLNLIINGLKVHKYCDILVHLFVGIQHATCYGPCPFNWNANNVLSINWNAINSINHHTTTNSFYKRYDLIHRQHNSSNNARTRRLKGTNVEIRKPEINMIESYK